MRSQVEPHNYFHPAISQGRNQKIGAMIGNSQSTNCSIHHTVVTMIGLSFCSLGKRMLRMSARTVCAERPLWGLAGLETLREKKRVGTPVRRSRPLLKRQLPLTIRITRAKISRKSTNSI